MNFKPGPSIDPTDTTATILVVIVVVVVVVVVVVGQQHRVRFDLTF